MSSSGCNLHWFTLDLTVTIVCQTTRLYGYGNVSVHRVTTLCMCTYVCFPPAESLNQLNADTKRRDQWCILHHWGMLRHVSSDAKAGCWLVHLFGPCRNVSTTVEWIYMKFCASIYDPQKLNANGFSNLSSCSSGATSRSDFSFIL